MQHFTYDRRELWSQVLAAAAAGMLTTIASAVGDAFNARSGRAGLPTTVGDTFGCAI
jgi:hypothetical protein